MSGSVFGAGCELSVSGEQCGRVWELAGAGFLEGDDVWPRFGFRPRWDQELCFLVQVALVVEL